MTPPNLSGYQYVQLETHGTHARMTYKRKSVKGLSFIVLLLEKGPLGWGIVGNYKSDFDGHETGDADGLRQVLDSPEVQFREK